MFTTNSAFYVIEWSALSISPCNPFLPCFHVDDILSLFELEMESLEKSE
jgi:hypothetical protein